MHFAKADTPSVCATRVGSVNKEEAERSPGCFSLWPGLLNIRCLRIEKSTAARISSSFMQVEDTAKHYCIREAFDVATPILSARLYKAEVGT